jgi:hypothetical protein
MPARHTSLQDGLLLEADFTPEALVDERGCRRDIRSNGWIAFEEFALQNGPAEETSFLRSVRILRSAISPGPQSLHVKSDPDVFADALVPRPGQIMPGAPTSWISPKQPC